jgi:hypothetical protein
LFRSQREIPPAPAADATDEARELYARNMLSLFAPALLQQTWVDQQASLFTDNLTNVFAAPVLQGHKTWWQVYEEHVPCLDAHAQSLIRRANATAAKKERERVAASKAAARKSDKAKEGSSGSTLVDSVPSAGDGEPSAADSESPRKRRRAPAAPVASEHQFRRGSGRVLWLQLNEVVLLTKQVRCTDPEYLDILTRTRVGNCRAADVIELKKHILGNGKTAKANKMGQFPRAVVTRNALRTSLNDTAVEFTARVTGTALTTWDAQDSQGKVPIPAGSAVARALLSPHALRT